MENTNLVLRFKLVGDSDSRVRAAARIMVDQHGSLTIYDAGSGLTEKLPLADLQSISIRPLRRAGNDAPALRVVDHHATAIEAALKTTRSSVPIS